MLLSLRKEGKTNKKRQQIENTLNKHNKYKVISNPALQ